MRRLTGLVSSALLMLAVLSVPVAASADVDADATVVLAVEGEPAGPNPMDRQDADNRARELVSAYEDPETPFTWGAAWILTFAGLVGLALMGGLYYLLVHRPAQEGAEEQ